MIRPAISVFRLWRLNCSFVISSVLTQAATSRLFFARFDDCRKDVTRLLAPDKLDGVVCRTCRNPLTRTPGAPTSTRTETLDNGHMMKSIERPVEAERLYRERARLDLSKE